MKLALIRRLNMAIDGIDGADGISTIWLITVKLNSVIKYKKKLKLLMSLALHKVRLSVGAEPIRLMASKVSVNAVR